MDAVSINLDAMSGVEFVLSGKALFSGSFLSGQEKK